MGIFTYEGNGLMLTAANSNGAYSFSYDGTDNQTQVIDSFGGTQTSVYDVENRLTKREYAGQGQNLREDFTTIPGPDYYGERYSDLTATTLVASTTGLYDGAGNTTNIASYDGSSTLIDKFISASTPRTTSPAKPTPRAAPPQRPRTATTPITSSPTTAPPTATSVLGNLKKSENVDFLPKT